MLFRSDGMVQPVQQFAAREAAHLGGEAQEGGNGHFRVGRRAFRQKAEARANTLAMQLLFPVVFFLMPPILAILLGPPLFELKEHLSSNLVKSHIGKATKVLDDGVANQ